MIEKCPTLPLWLGGALFLCLFQVALWASMISLVGSPTGSAMCLTAIVDPFVEVADEQLPVDV